jgi:hypothetical protein
MEKYSLSGRYIWKYFRLEERIWRIKKIGSHHEELKITLNQDTTDHQYIKQGQRMNKLYNMWVINNFAVGINSLYSSNV